MVQKDAAIFSPDIVKLLLCSSNDEPFGSLGEVILQRRYFRGLT